MICTMQTLACALHHYFRINRVEVSLIQSICGQFKDRQNKSLKIGKQSCKVELYFRFRLTLIENHFSCIYAMALLCSFPILSISRGFCYGAWCNISIQQHQPTNSIDVELTQHAQFLMLCAVHANEKENNTFVYRHHRVH